MEIDWDFLAEARASRCRRFRCCAVHPEADPPDLAGYPDLEGHSRTSVVCAIAFSCATVQPRLCIRETLRQAANEVSDRPSQEMTTPKLPALRSFDKLLRVLR